MRYQNPTRTEIDVRLDELADRGFEPKIVVLSLDKYQALMQSLAAESGQELSEAQLYYRRCLLVAVTVPDFLEVTPDVREMWERSAEFAPPSSGSDSNPGFTHRRDSAQRRVEPRFTEL